MADKWVSGKEACVNLSRVNPDDGKGIGGEGSGDVDDRTELEDMIIAQGEEQKIEEKWLINPNVILLGPKIGEGGHAKVYEGIYKSSSVAVKIIQAGLTEEEHAKRRKRFMREVVMLSRVQHENLVKLIGVCMEPAMVIVTEYLKGGSLKKFLRALRPNHLDLHLSVRFALDISRGMESLHANGIIHRDLKPDNLLLTEDKNKLKLADFGLAREETVTEMMTAETGTYRWMAPELYSTVTLKEKKHYTHKVDIYSFAIVLWELITNRTPFEGMSNLQAAYASAFKKSRPPLDNIPKDLGTLLDGCWAEDPLMRPEFREISGMLSSFLATLQVPSSVRSTQTTPPAKVEMGQCSTSSSYPLAADSPGTRHLMGGTSRGEEGADDNSKSNMFGCFDNCFS
ncbi:serine/threonine/tyrosine-protein kinase HT1-like [Aristolochia californica]|uniref:serine/threonine/tyrosine-protein kinase HT1-like n=1 Tax=Aristolochia californica TaxID=171875 RepID=UPI0035E2372F